MGWLTSKSSSSSSVDPYTRAAVQENMDWARRAASQPFTQYGGNWSAAPSQDQQYGVNNIRGSYTQGMNELNGAATGARSAQGYQPMMTKAGTGADFMDGYFNPFLQKVVGGMTDEMGRARQIQISADEDKALAAKAYGGSRHGVMDAETTRGFFDTLGRNVGSLYAQGFDTAAGLGMQDANRQLQSDQGNQQTDLGAGQLRLAGSSLLHNVGDTKHANYLDSAKAQFGAGTALQALEQARIDREREKFNEWRDYPLRQFGIMNAATGTAVGGKSVTTSEKKTPSVLEQIGTFGGMFF